MNQTASLGFLALLLYQLYNQSDQGDINKKPSNYLRPDYSKSPSVKKLM